MEERRKIITIEYFPDKDSVDLSTLEREISAFREKGFIVNIFSDCWQPPNDFIEQQEIDYLPPALLVTAEAELDNHSLPESAEIEIICDFILSPHIEIIGSGEQDYLVKFTDNQTGETLDEAVIKPGFWVNADRKWFTEWKVAVFLAEQRIFEHFFSVRKKKVFISFQSKSLKNTLAWFPFLVKFKEKHDCYLVVSTSFNNLFQNKYPEIDFVEPDADVTNLYAAYEIGIFSEAEKRHKNDPHLIPLQQVAADYLGIEYSEIKPEIFWEEQDRIISGNYVCIFAESEESFKFLSKKGWQEIVDELNKTGFRVIVLGKEKSRLRGVEDLAGELSLNETINYLHFSRFFIGQSSDLSWLAWTLNVPVILLAGLKSLATEFQQGVRVVKPETKKLRSGKNKREINPKDIWQVILYFLAQN